MLLGLNHKTAPVEVRERLAFSPSEVPSLAQSLKQECDLAEVAVLSTCNRTEVVAWVHRLTAGTPWRVMDALISNAAARAERRASSIAPQPFLQPSHLYIHTNEAAVHHLFRVSAGLDSLVLGEPQILGQVRQALVLAEEAGTVGPFLRRLMETALRVGKRARSETAISEGAASISHAAVELASRVFGDLEGRNVLLVGAGKMGELAARNLAEHGISSIFVANRTFARAQELALSFRGKAVPFESLGAWLREIDIVITSTGAPDYVITEGMVKQALPARRGKPLFFIDIAVPRDVDPQVHRLQGVFLYNVDDLQQVVEANLGQREACIGEVEAIIAQERASFTGWLREREAVPVIAHMRQAAEAVRLQELERALRRLSHLSEADKEQVRALTVALTNKLLHGPTVRLKEELHSDDGWRVLEAAARLFGAPNPASAWGERGSGADAFQGEGSGPRWADAPGNPRRGDAPASEVVPDPTRPQGGGLRERARPSSIRPFRTLTSEGGYPV